MQWMVEMSGTSLGDVDEVRAAFTTGPTASVAKAFLDGTGPNLLFLSRYAPTPEQLAEGAPPPPKFVLHSGTPGKAYSTVGLAEDSGRLVYFTRDLPANSTKGVNADVAQDLTVLYGELLGDPAACLASLLSGVMRPLTEAIGPTGKASPGHVDQYLKSLDRLAQEISDTSNALEVCFLATSQQCFRIVCTKFSMNILLRFFCLLDTCCSF